MPESLGVKDGDLAFSCARDSIACVECSDIQNQRFDDKGDLAKAIYII